MTAANPQSRDIAPQGSTFQSKITHRTKTQEDLKLNEEKKKKKENQQTATLRWQRY